MYKTMNIHFNPFHSDEFSKAYDLNKQRIIHFVFQGSQTESETYSPPDKSA